MSDVVIRVENLSKKYTLNRAKGQSSGDGIRHAIQDAVGTPLRWAKKRAESRKQKAENNKAEGADQFPLSTFNSPNLENSSSEEFYALRDVSFEVRRGEVLGIIGRNGAGKSTLLKILSRITEPTSGRIGIKGRVASLLEVGTGFHPELSGRENIYLNGAILGMSRAEVKRKFDEIVAFAEVEKFLDTPVKRYSSGMYVRLAFAVAAHLEPEILIVDEVLAVGDAEFQKKCLGKMQDVSKGGRTVLFVSHNLAVVEQLCSVGVVLTNGHVTYRGSTAPAIETYLSLSRKAVPRQLKINHSSGDVLLDSMCAGSGTSTNTWNCNESLPITIQYTVKQAVKNLEISLRLERAGTFVGTCFVSEFSGITLPTTIGTHELCFTIAPLSLLNDIYDFYVWIHDPMVEGYAAYPSALSLTVLNHRYNQSRIGNPNSLGALFLSLVTTSITIKSHASE